MGLNRAPEFCQALIQQFLIEELALATDPLGILAARQVKDVREIPGDRSVQQSVYER